jgi:DNA-binding CsgD family transcriptional regulator
LTTIDRARLDASSSSTEDIYSELRSALSPASDIKELRNRVLLIINKLGVSDFLFVRVQRNWDRVSGPGLLYSVPEDYMKIYHDEKMHQSDLMLPYVKTNTQPIFASQVYGYLEKAPFEIELMEKNRSLQQLNKRFQYYDQFSIPMKASNGVGNVQLCVLQKGATPEEFQSHVSPLISTLRSLCKAIDTITTVRFRASFIGKHDDKVLISPRQLAVFSMLSNNDLSIGDLADLMCISPITAHQHISGGRKALGVSTNIAAIKKLIKLGLIEFQ